MLNISKMHSSNIYNIYNGGFSSKMFVYFILFFVDITWSTLQKIKKADNRYFN